VIWEVYRFELRETIVFPSAQKKSKGSAKQNKSPSQRQAKRRFGSANGS
jgi:hypothetical protein